ncbi:MAG: hydroxyacid dehydrogenase [Promethearchaeota archaeon]
MTETSRVLVTDPIHKDAISRMEAAGLEVVVRTDISADELLQVIGEYDAIVVRGRTKVTSEVIRAGQRLKIIGRSGVGLDNVDRAAAKERGIHVVNSPEGPSVSVAELVFALTFSVLRRVSFADQGMRTGKWLKKACKGNELKGRTLGIIGFGFIGEEVAKRALAFGMQVLAYDILPDRIEVIKTIGADYKPLEELLADSDILTIHVPLNPKTKGLIGTAEIAKMRKGAIIINTSRGGIVDEKALYEALVSEKLGGAGLDVFSEEPPFQNELLCKIIAFSNVVSTPHIGAMTIEAELANSMIIAEKLLKHLKQ